MHAYKFSYPGVITASVSAGVFGVIAIILVVVVVIQVTTISDIIVCIHIHLYT